MQTPIIEEIRIAARNLQHTLNLLPQSRELSTAKTKLDEAFLWAVAASQPHVSDVHGGPLDLSVQVPA